MKNGSGLAGRGETLLDGALQDRVWADLEKRQVAFGDRLGTGRRRAPARGYCSTSTWRPSTCRRLVILSRLRPSGSVPVEHRSSPGPRGVRRGPDSSAPNETRIAPQPTCEHPILLQSFVDPPEGLNRSRERHEAWAVDRRELRHLDLRRCRVVPPLLRAQLPAFVRRQMSCVATGSDGDDLYRIRQRIHARAIRRRHFSNAVADHLRAGWTPKDFQSSTSATCSPKIAGWARCCLIDDATHCSERVHLCEERPSSELLNRVCRSRSNASTNDRLTLEQLPTHAHH